MQKTHVHARGRALSGWQGVLARRKVRHVVRCRWFVACAVLLMPGVATLAAQPSQEPSAQLEAPSGGPTFRAAVDLVALTVAVTDREDRYIAGLQPEDFQVFEDGVAQPLSFFGVADVALDLALLVDTSASMTGQMALVRRAAGGLVRQLQAGDRGSLVEFRDVVRVVQPMTSDLGLIDEGLDGLQPAGGTALHNAIYIAIKNFERHVQDTLEVRRQAIVVLSDGDDTTSLLGFDEVLDLARRHGVTIFTVGLRPALERIRGAGQGGHFSQSTFALRSLARETGGQSFFPDEAHELGPVYAAIANELSHQYALGYTPTNPRQDGTYRRVVVRIASRPEARSRTRAGYFAPAPAAARRQAPAARPGLPTARRTEK